MTLWQLESKDGKGKMVTDLIMDGFIVKGGVSGVLIHDIPIALSQIPKYTTMRFR
jgi:hypothetical protein